MAPTLIELKWLKLLKIIQGKALHSAMYMVIAQCVVVAIIIIAFIAVITIIIIITIEEGLLLSGQEQRLVLQECLDSYFTPIGLDKRRKI